MSLSLIHHPFSPLSSSYSPLQTSLRLFSTTSSPHARSCKSALAHAHRNLPPYPYGPKYTYKQSNFGLYGGSHIQFGNNVSEKNEIKTRRTWKPNIHAKRLWSDALARFVRIRVQARVLRTIDKVGGLDEYLLGGKAARLKELGMGGWRLRAMIMRTDKVKERFQREREALGLIVGSKGVVEGAEAVGINEEEEIDEDVEEEEDGFGDEEFEGEDEEFEDEDEEFEDEEEGEDEDEDEEGDDRKFEPLREKGL